MRKLEAFNKFLSRLSKREKMLLYAAVFFVGVSFLVRSVIFPVYARIKMLDNEIKEKEFGINKNIRILSHQDRIKSEATKFASFLSKVESEEEGITSLLKEIENLANKSLLYVVDMKPGGVRQEKDNTKRYVVNLSCEGEMEQIMDFMYNVENSGSLLTIDRYQISPKSKESAVAQCAVSISKIAF